MQEQKWKSAATLLVGLLCIIAPDCGLASGWVGYGGDDSGVYFYDKASIKRDGQFVKAWIYKNEFPPHDAGVKSVRVLEEHDCYQGRFRVLMMDNFSKLSLEGDIF